MNKLTLLLKQKKLTIAVAESCTGGSLAALLTSENGASVYFDRGYVVYSNQAKIDMLGVKTKTLDDFGAVSEQTAMEMTKGMIKKSITDLAVAITGIAGPTGSSKEKPIGMACFGFYIIGKYFTTTQYFKGDRAKNIKSSINFVIDFLFENLKNINPTIIK